MKTLIYTSAAAFFVLVVLTTFVPYPQARADALAAGFTEDDINIGLQLTRERRLFMWGATALELTLLCIFAMPPFARKLADRWLAWTGGQRVLAALGVGLTYWIIHEILSLPIGIARLYHGQAWGFVNLDLLGWLHDHGLYFGIQLALSMTVLGGFYVLLLIFPRTWWLIAPVGMSVLGIAFAYVLPIWISPLFNDFTPLSQTQWKDQQPRVQALITEAGIPVQEILVMNASRQSNHTNAYFTGFGSTRRIVLYDTLLKKHTPDEIESVLAHEIGHWQKDHITKGILLGALAALAGCFVLDRLLRAAVGRAPWHLQSVADPAGVPLLLLLIYLGNWAAMPVQNAVSRYFERQADQVSLELANRPDAFRAGEEKMARDNKSNVAPTPWNVWLFSSHPTTVERIRTAEEWKEKASTKGTK
jgi:STE24 endopeptidase